MTHKEFFNELQKSCHTDAHQCATLLNSLLKLMAQAAIDQIPVTLKGLGTFISHKHPEYIQENEHTGEQTLYPPRITYRMQPFNPANSPSEKSIDNELADFTDLPLDIVVSFLDNISRIIIEHLQKHEEVEIHGLGLFHIIDAHHAELHRIAFTPDEQMREQVNAPFNCFEPVIIRKGITVKEPIESGKESKSEADHSAEQDTLNITLKEEPAETALQIITDTEKSEEAGPISNVEAGATSESEIQDTVEDEKPVETEVNRTVEKRTNKKAYLFSAIVLCIIICSVLFIFLSINRSKPEPIAFDPKTELIVLEPEAEPVVLVQDSVATLSEIDSLKENLSDSIIQPEIVKEEKSSVSANSQKEKVQKAEPKVFHRLSGPDGEPIMITLNPGERLTIVSLNHFGDKAFWPYVFDVNTDRLKTPNMVQAGMKLYLPDPAFYGIDATNEESLRKAKNMGAKLLQQ